MTFEDSIYDFLQKGGNLEDYLNEVSAAANQAQARIQEEKKRQSADAAKLEAADLVAQSINTFGSTFYPGVEYDLSGNDVIEVFSILEPFMKLFAAMPDRGKPDRDQVAKNDPIEDFLNAFVRGK